MNDVQAQTIYLSDYQVPDFLIEKTDLVFSIREDFTKVVATLVVIRNEQSSHKDTPLVLHGEKLTLKSIAVDGRELGEGEYTVDAESLSVSVPDRCIITCVTLIKPQENTSLEGLYKSSGMYCTQCEAEGFRKITYYLDRPDVMSEFSTKIIADKNQYPVLLSNGNLIAEGELEDNLHWAQWRDPFKKPAYLFALVAGVLEFVEDSFTTMSGREVTLRIFVEAKDLDKCDHAMQSLKHAMRWDEDVYGREYDLDIFMIVAVDDFNMGAMENKGLNIFNTSCILAKPETTTDLGFQRVEAVVAHEYFHNWSGNRVTCRDWFQLSLKEGFTVFRDAEFSADMGSRAVKRVEDVTLLRTLQFAEDAGPMAHPVQPPSFIEISNFYTLTIYEKGAEVVRMIHTLLGEELFREGSDLYFQRHDGQAVTIEDFIAAMEAVSGRDLTQFKYWYTQAGTPVVTASEYYDDASKTYQLTLEQSCPETPEATSAEKQPYHLPFSVGLIVDQKLQTLCLQGEALDPEVLPTSKVLEVTQAKQSFVFTGIDKKPVPSLLQNFSAPVRLVFDRSRDDYLQLLCYDQDAFSRWDAAQQLAVLIIRDIVKAYQNSAPINIDNTLLLGFKQVLADTDLDKAILALILTLPSEAYLTEIADEVDVEAIHFARKTLKVYLAEGLQEQWLNCYQSLATDKAYQASSQDIAERSLKNIALDYLMLLELSHEDIAARCYQQFETANNMTDTMAALKALVHGAYESSAVYRSRALDHFYQQWKNETLVVNEWLKVQATVPAVETLNTVKELMEHESFSMTNPNKIRSLIGGFCQNSVSFHQPSGDGYEFLADQIIALNTINPQIAARMVTPLTRWRKYSKELQALMRAALQRIHDTPELSKDVYEVVSKSL